MKATPFHSSNPSLFGRPPGVRAACRVLAPTVLELRFICASLLDLQPTTPILTSITLSDFAARLSSYFDAKDSGSYLEVLSEGRPDLDARVTRLRIDHDGLRDSIADVRHLAREAARLTPVLAVRIGDLVDEYERLEAVEALILADFFSGGVQPAALRPRSPARSARP